MTLRSILDALFLLPPVGARRHWPISIGRFMLPKGSDIQRNQDYIFLRLMDVTFYALLATVSVILLNFYQTPGHQPLQHFFKEFNKYFWIVCYPIIIFYYAMFKYNVDIRSEMIAPGFFFMNGKNETKLFIYHAGSLKVYIALFLLCISVANPHILPSFFFKKSVRLLDEDFLILVLSVLDCVLHAIAALCLLINLLVLEKKHRWPEAFRQTEL